MIDDIPEAVRETLKKPAVPKQVSRKSPLLLLMSGSFVIAIAIASGLIWFLNRSNASVSKPSSPPNIKTSEIKNSKPKTTPEPTVKSAKTPEEPVDNVLGHLAYEEAQLKELVAITNDGRILLHKTAAEKFRQMEADARAQGIELAVISGFRTLDSQNSLFFDVKEQRVQNAAKRAEVSAPPGYSEHHTGYAIDLGDATVPATHLTTKFEQTAAFQWLAKNAAKYSFELSFPKGNPQGISYEPWHWRFVGDRNSLETFYKARNLKK